MKTRNIHMSKVLKQTGCNGYGPCDPFLVKQNQAAIIRGNLALNINTTHYSPGLASLELVAPGGRNPLITPRPAISMKYYV